MSMVEFEQILAEILKKQNEESPENIIRSFTKELSIYFLDALKSDTYLKQLNLYLRCDKDSITIEMPPVTFHKYGPIKRMECIVRVRQKALMFHFKQSLEAEFRHPHMNSGSMCWSDFDSINNAIEGGYYTDAIIEMISVVNNFIPQQAYFTPSYSIPCLIKDCNRNGCLSLYDPRHIADNKVPYTSYVCSHHGKNCSECLVMGMKMDNDGNNIKSIVKTGYCLSCLSKSICPSCDKNAIPSKLVRARYVPVHSNPSSFKVRKMCRNCRWKCVDCASWSETKSVVKYTVRQHDMCYRCFYEGRIRLAGDQLKTYYRQQLNKKEGK